MRHSSSDDIELHAELPVDIPRPNKVDILILPLIAVLGMIPVLLREMVYPSAGGDSLIHLRRIGTIGAEHTETLYFGQALVGYPMRWISDWTGASLEVLFLWFSFIMMATVGVVLYIVISSLVNRTAGLAVVLLAMFCSMGIMVLFHTGTIFNIINMWIILPIALYFVVMWTIHRGWQNALAAILFCTLFSVFHPTGTLLPPTLALFFSAMMLSKHMKKHKLLTFGSILVILTAIAAIYCFWLPGKEIKIISTQQLGIASNSWAALALKDFIIDHLRITTLMILAVSIGLIAWKRKVFGIRRETKLFIAMLLCLIAILVPLTFTGIHPDPRRGGIDLATMVAILTACLVGVIWHNNRNMGYGLLSVALIGAIPTLVLWFNYQGG